MAKHKRPRLSAIELLPPQCEGVIAWAAQELAKRERSLTEIYQDFKVRLTAIKEELDLDFDVPAFASFGRHSVRLGNLRGRVERSTMLAKAMIENTDAQTEDQLTRGATLTLKNLIFEMLEYAGEAGFEPKQAVAMATAIRQLAQAENVSTARRQLLEKEFAEKAKQAVGTVGKARGLTQDTMDEINRRLGVV